jgi:hypothetical protein
MNYASCELQIAFARKFLLTKIFQFHNFISLFTGLKTLMGWKALMGGCL